MPLYLDDFEPPDVPDDYLRALLRIAASARDQPINPATAVNLLRSFVMPLLAPEHQPFFMLSGAQPSWERLYLLYANLAGASEGRDPDLLAAATLVDRVIRHTTSPPREMSFPQHLELASFERVVTYLGLPAGHPTVQIGGHVLRLYDFCRYCWLPAGAKGVCRQHSTRRVEMAAHRDSRGSYGRPRITQQLRQQGERVSAERVRRSLNRQGLRPVYRRAWVATTDSRHRLPVAPNLLDRRFDGWEPNRAWVADITYIATDEGWLYLAAVMDLASRRIVGWSMSETIDAKLVCAALRSAYWQRKPGAGLLVHTDRGSQYASHEYRRLAADFAITMSMSKKADCWDNAAMESFFKTLKVERIYQVRYDTRARARLDIVDWIEGFYNRVRMHTAIGYLAPVERERSLLAA